VIAGLVNTPVVVVGEGQPRMDAVAGHVAGDHGIQVRDVDDRQRSGVGSRDGT
jgi:hypothetical protein